MFIIGRNVRIAAFAWEKWKSRKKNENIKKISHVHGVVAGSQCFCYVQTTQNVTKIGRSPKLAICHHPLPQ